MWGVIIVVIMAVDAQTAGRAGFGARVRPEMAANEVMKPRIRVATRPL
jgi:hypothetical protein